MANPFLAFVPKVDPLGSLLQGQQYGQQLQIPAARREAANILAQGGDPRQALSKLVALGDVQGTQIIGQSAQLGKQNFGQIGQDAYGNKTFGFIDPYHQTVTPTVAQNATQPTLQQPNLKGQEYLNTLPKPLADQVRALSEGRMQFPSGFAIKSPYWQEMITRVSQYDPSFDAINYNARAKTRSDFVSGKSAQNITSFNTAIQHLDTLEKSIAALGNRTSPVYNQATGAIQSQYDPHYQAALKKFQAAKTALAEELTRAFRGTGGNVHDIVQWSQALNEYSSPLALRAALKQAVELLRGRMEALANQYNRGMGTTKDPLELLSPKARQTLKRLGIEMPAFQTGQTNTPGQSNIPQGAVDALRNNPALRGQFDAKYGPGSAARILGQ